MVGLPDGEKNWRYIYSFSHDPRTWRTHRRIDTAWRQRLRLMLASRDNKRLRTSYHFVEANYWRTQSIARPLCNSRATCHWLGLPVCIKLSRRVLYGLCVVRRDRRQTDHLIIYECACLVLEWYTVLFDRNFSVLPTTVRVFSCL